MKQILLAGPQWFAGFFEDQKGSASSKRAALYFCLFLLYLIVHGSLEGKAVDFNVLAVVGGLVLFLVGAVTTEFFNRINAPEKPTV